MNSYKVWLLVSVLCAAASAEYSFQRYEPQSHLTTGYQFTNPWTFDYHDPYEFAASDSQPTYAKYSETDSDSLPFDGPKDFFAAATKKVPRENKHFKKVVSPFYTITDSDSQKYKDFVLKSGVPYCEEIKGTSKGDGKGMNVCYKCKNPKTGAAYEKCSYVSDPLKSGSDIAEDFAESSSEKSSPPSGFRSRRSNSESEASATTATNFKSTPEYEKHGNPYRFSDEVFSESVQGVPAQYKNKGEECEKTVKGSMVCMVCKDSKTNGKYEQCSYVRKPNEKAYSYSKSSSYKNPGSDKEQSPEGAAESRVGREYPEVKPVEEQKESDRSADESSAEETSSNCKKVQEGSKTCMICKDSKTGGNYEKCSYAYQPNDKIYKFSKSKSFGYPTSSYQKEDTSKDYQDGSSKGSGVTPGSYPGESSSYSEDYSVPAGFYDKYYKAPSSAYYGDTKSSSSYRPPGEAESYKDAYEGESSAYKDDSSPDHVKSESEAQAEKIGASNCEKVHKDSMICDVCKDPKTGANSEKCTYVYKPKEKLYSYSKSSSFGSPTETDGKISYGPSGSQRKSEEPRGAAYLKSRSGPQEENKYFQAESDTRREFREIPTSSEATVTTSDGPAERKSKAGPKKVDLDFYDTMKKKAEIEKFLQEFQKEDRSNCKKIMRDKMTCYQCVDKKGFQKEECAFIRAEDPEKEKISYREMKEYQVEPVKKVPRSAKTESPGKSLEDIPLEPAASASENSYEAREKPVKEDKEDARYEEKLEEAEPYEYTAETRPVFDKVLGLTLPAYMLSRSEHEAEFDEIVASGRI